MIILTYYFTSIVPFTFNFIPHNSVYRRWTEELNLKAQFILTIQCVRINTYSSRRLLTDRKKELTLERPLFPSGFRVLRAQLTQSEADQANMLETRIQFYCNKQTNYARLIWQVESLVQFKDFRELQIRNRQSLVSELIKQIHDTNLKKQPNNRHACISHYTNRKICILCTGIYRPCQRPQLCAAYSASEVRNRKNVQTGGHTAQDRADLTIRNIVYHYCMITT